MEPWFKPLAYAIILLRKDGYPCLFYPDYYGAEYDDKGRDGNMYHISMPSHRFMIDTFLHARRHYAYGPQYDYFDHPNTIGWTRLGDENHRGGMAVLMSNGGDGWKWMETGHANETYEDITGHVATPVVTNKDGWGYFMCLGGKVSVWMPGQR